MKTSHICIWLAFSYVYGSFHMHYGVEYPPLRSGYACVWNIYWTASAANNSGCGSHVLVL